MSEMPVIIVGMAGAAVPALLPPMRRGRRPGTTVCRWSTFLRCSPCMALALAVFAGSMMLALRRVRVFFEVADRRSFSAAAAALDYTQPSVSHHVSALERELGQRLINRGTRPLSLTQAGEVLYAAAGVAVAEFSRAELELRELKDGQSGRVALGSVVSGLRTVVPPA